MSDDVDRAMFRLAALTEQAPDVAVLFHLEIDGEPIPKGRARTGQGRVYTPERTRRAQRDLTLAIRSASAGRPRPVFRGPVAVSIAFFRSSAHGVDLDNLTKLVLDAGTLAQLWHDDRQVRRQAESLDVDRARPRTVLSVYPLQPPLFAKDQEDDDAVV